MQERGRPSWDREVRRMESVPSIHTKNSHASPTPIVHDGSVFVHFGTLGMARLSAEDGSIQWLNNELQYNPLHGSGGSPVLMNGKLVVACDGTADPFVAAVDAETGKLAWRTPRSVAARISHSFVTAARLLSSMAKLRCSHLVRIISRFTIWRPGQRYCKVRAPGWSVVPQPAIGHGMVFYNHDYDNPELMAYGSGLPEMLRIRMWRGGLIAEHRVLLHRCSWGMSFILSLTTALRLCRRKDR